MKLKISNELSLPPEAVTQTFAILAKRGVGKTYTAAVMTEELLKAALQVVVVDPIGVWWGLRASANGKDEGLSIVVMGGDHGDVPLEATGGELVADFVVESGRSVVLDLSAFRKGEMIRFMTTFTETIYRRNRAPLHLVVDEADAFAPQKTMHGEGAERLLGAMEDIVRRGRARGLGCTLITQRAAVLNKNVLTQIEVLVCLRTIAPQDRDAVDAWINVHGTIEQRKTLLDSLPSLPIGEAWFWSPGWLDLFQRVKVRQRETFDSSSTPKAGEKVAVPKKLKPVDLDELRTKMAATIEKAKAEDPRELRKEIARLNGENARLRTIEARLPVPCLTDEEIDLLTAAKVWMGNGFAKRLEAMAEKFHSTLASALVEVRKVTAVTTRVDAIMQKNMHNLTPAMTPIPTKNPDRLPRSSAPTGEIKISSTQQRILDALAWFGSIGNSSPTALQVGAIALIDATGGHFSNVVGPLSSNGLVTRGQGTLALTEEGRRYARQPERVATLADYHDVLRQRVRKAKSANGKTVAILDVVISRGGGEVTTEEIGREVSIDPTGGHFSNTIGPLGTLGLIKRSPGIVRPTEIIFPPGLQ